MFIAEELESMQAKISTTQILPLRGYLCCSLVDCQIAFYVNSSQKCFIYRFNNLNLKDPNIVVCLCDICVCVCLCVYTYLCVFQIWNYMIYPILQYFPTHQSILHIS